LVRLNPVLAGVSYRLARAFVLGRHYPVRRCVYPCFSVDLIRGHTYDAGVGAEHPLVEGIRDLLAEVDDLKRTVAALSGQPARSERTASRDERDDLLTPEDVAEITKLTPTTIRRLAARGEIEAHKTANRWRITREALGDWLERSKPRPRNLDPGVAPGPMRGGPRYPRRKLAPAEAAIRGEKRD
jgi:excisionase family DNA binding protein